MFDMCIRSRHSPAPLSNERHLRMYAVWMYEYTTQVFVCATVAYNEVPSSVPFKQNFVSSLPPHSQDHPFISGLIFVLVTWLLVLMFRCFAVHTPSSNPHKKKAYKIWDTIRNPAKIFVSVPLEGRLYADWMCFFCLFYRHNPDIWDRINCRQNVCHLKMVVSFSICLILPMRHCYEGWDVNDAQQRRSTGVFSTRHTGGICRTATVVPIPVLSRTVIFAWYAVSVTSPWYNEGRKRIVF